MQEARTLCERDRVKIIKRGQAAGKKIAIDQPFCKPLGPPQTKSQTPIDKPPLAPRLPRHFGIMAYTGDREARRIDAPQHMESTKLSLSGVTRVSAMA